MNRLWLCGAAVAVTMGASGCAVTVPGAAVRDPNAGPNITMVTAAQIDSVLLPVDQVKRIVGVSSLRIDLDVDHLSEPPGTTSKPDCVGAFYGGVEDAYRGSDVTDARDQILKEPGESTEYWIEQTAVLHETTASADRFLTTSTTRWQNCAGRLSIDENGTQFEQEMGDAVVQDGILRQSMRAADEPDLSCQHALSAVANLTVETFVCSFDARNEAVEMAKAMLARATKK